jgi:hypothetical protein
MQDPSQDATVPVEADSPLAAVAMADDQQRPRATEDTLSRPDWRKAVLSKLRSFLLTRSVEP